MPVETAAVTDIGRQSDHNEDSVLVAPTSSGRLLAVADGMGGHQAGDVASATALDGFVDGLATKSVAGAVQTAVQNADQAVKDEATGNPERDSMGTTLVAAIVDGDTATVVNVGDSRAYRLGESGIEQITVDQSVVQELVDDGEITASEAAVHPRRNVLSQALGATESVEPDCYTVEFAPGETLLLCSDGLTAEVSDAAIRERVVAADSLDDATTALVETANANGGSDNISAVLGRPR